MSTFFGAAGRKPRVRCAFHLSFYHKNRHIPPPILLKRLFAPADRPPMNPAGGSLPGTPWWKGRGWI